MDDLDIQIKKGDHIGGKQNFNLAGGMGGIKLESNS